MAQPRVIVTRLLPDPVQARLLEHFTVALNRSDKPFTSARLIRALSEADGILCSPNDLFSEEIFEAGPPLRTRILANAGTDTDNIDLDAAEAARIAVTNAPVDDSDAVADLAIALILACARRMTRAEACLRQGNWAGSDPTSWTGVGLAGRTLGLVGLGSAGRATARRAALGFGMRVLSHDPQSVSVPGVTVEPCTSLADLLAAAEFVSLHPCTVPGAEPVLDAERISQMKPGAFLVNTARGSLVHEPALVRALREGKLSGAGLDVFPDPPHVSRELLDLDSVTLLPHIGAATMENRIRMGMTAVDSLLAFFSGGTVPSRVV